MKLRKEIDEDGKAPLRIFNLLQCNICLANELKISKVRAGERISSLAHLEDLDIEGLDEAQLRQMAVIHFDEA